MAPAQGHETSVARFACSWTAATDSNGGVTYRLQISHDGAFSSLAVDSPGLSSTTSPSATFGSAWYAWRVIASDTFGNQTVSETRVFAIDAEAPPAPTLRAPRSGETLTSSTVELKWDASTDPPLGNSALASASSAAPVRYNVQVSRFSSFSPLLSNDTMTETRAFLVLSSVDTGIFFWRVAAVDRMGNRAASTDTFRRAAPTDTIPPQPPMELRGIALETGGVKLEWQPSPSPDMAGGGYRIYWDSGLRTGADTLLDYVPHQSAGPITYITGVLTIDSIYRFRVQSVDALGNSDLNTNMVEVRVRGGAPPYAQTEIITPHAGHRVTRAGGVEVVARVLGADVQRSSVTAVRFQYRPSGGTWTDMAVMTNQSNPAAFGGAGNVNVHWDARSIPDTAVDLRAVPVLGGFAAETMAEVIRIELVSNPSDASINMNASASADTFRIDQVVFRDRQDTIMAITPSGRLTEIVLDSGAARNASDTNTVRLRVALTPKSPIDTRALGSSHRQEVGLVTDVSFSDSSQPGADVWIILPLPDMDADRKITVNGTKVSVFDLEVWTYSSDTGKWEKLGMPQIDLDAKTARFRARHFSFFTLAAPVAAVANLSGLQVFPNPFVPNDASADNGVEYQAGVANTGVTFQNIPAASKLQIFDSLGSRVAEMVIDASGGAQWDARNGRGDKVASGVYIYLVTTPSGEHRSGKLVVIR